MEQLNRKTKSDNHRWGDWLNIKEEWPGKKFKKESKKTGDVTDGYLYFLQYNKSALCIWVCGTTAAHLPQRPPNYRRKKLGQAERVAGRQLRRGSMATDQPEQDSTSQSQAYKRNAQPKPPLLPKRHLQACWAGQDDWW